jgi:ferredoxin-NADP reductase
VARAALLGRLIGRRPIVWRTVTVREVVAETPRAVTLVLEVPDWPGHRAGQHADVRLTAEDGYQAQRSYSIASAPERDTLELTVELVDDGEVSPYFVQELRAGDQFELRGPIGGHFTWRVADGGPLLLVGGGSGVVPLMAMLRKARLEGRADLLRVLVSARRPDDLYYADELPGDGVRIVWTRSAPPDEPRRAGRMTVDDLASLVRAEQDVYVCGSPAFADAATDRLREAGVPDGVIRVERFGPSG